jgi:hypothetical protein
MSNELNTTASPTGGNGDTSNTQTQTAPPKTDEFAKHYGEVTANAAKYAERLAGIPEKPEAYKVELKFPDDVKLPEGINFDPSKDPRLPVLLKTAHEMGLTNAELNRIVALDAQFALDNHAAETARVAEEHKKLGDNAKARIDAASNWLNGQTGDGKTFTAAEAEEIRFMAGSAAGVTALEKLMAKANGTVPGHVPSGPGKPEPQSIAKRWYGGPSSQQAR